MRESKFRAWDKANKIMHKSNDLDVSEDYFTAFESGVMHLYHVSTIGDYTELEIIQCTGLKDNNGREIYEGDIMSYRGMRGDSLECLLLVEWNRNDAAFLFGGIRTDYACRYGEVIGNIYENRELLVGDIK